MRRLRAWLSRLGALFHRERHYREFAEEVESHLQLHIEDNLRAGMTPEEARRQALIKLGGIASVQERYGERRGIPAVETLARDVRYGLRMLGKSPGLTAIVAITLALGIGANTAIFSVLNGWLLRPLPVRAPEQINVLASQQKERRNPKLSYPALLDFQKQADAFSDLFAYGLAPSGGLSADGKASQFAYSAVTGNYFPALGVNPALGRLFFPGEGEKPNEELLVVLGWSYWQRRFGGDRSIAGRQVRVDGRPATIIGVGLFYVPLAQSYSSLGTLQVRSLVPPESLITGVQQEIRKLAPDLPILDVRTMQQVVQGLAGLFIFRLAASLAAVMGILGLTLAVMGVCGVVSFAVSQRTHEIGIRMALGAERGDILKLVSRQGLVLVIAGVAAGLAAAWALTRAMTKLLIGVSATDPATYAIVAILLLAVTLLACWIPARRALRVDPMVALRYE